MLSPVSSSNVSFKEAGILIAISFSFPEKHLFFNLNSLNRSGYYYLPGARR
jgi:hypothetical protein